MMKENVKSITVIAGDYPAPGHIMMVFIQQLVHAMIEQGIKVNVVAFQSITHALKHKKKRLPRHSKGITESGIEYDIYRPYTLSFGNHNPVEIITKRYNRYAIENQVKKIHGDVLYAHFWSSALPIYDYSLSKGIPLFVACGEGDNALEEMVANMQSKERDRLVKSVNGVVSVSSENKRKCIEFKLVEKEDIEVFPNSVNTEIFHKMDVSETKRKFGIKEDDFVVVFVGCFTQRKGPDRVAKAVSKLNDPHIKTIFIGKSFPGYPYDFDCPGIIHKGPVAHDLIPQYVNCADVFVLPTRKEGCSNAVVEALAMGIPVISSDGPFNDDILDEKNSIRVNADDVASLATAIKKLKDNADLRKSMSECSLSRHEEYTIQRRAKRILSFINKQLKKIR